MTNEEEKILEEEEVTLEEAAEEAEELQEEDKTETPEEESAEEARDIREEIRELRQELDQLRGGLRGVGHPEMIQTHLDNFLAKIAGETPIDDNPRNTTEFWLNEIAKNLPGGGGEPLYIHNIQIDATAQNVGVLLITIINKSADAYTDLTLRDYLTNNIGIGKFVNAGGFLATSSYKTLGFGVDNDSTHWVYQYYDNTFKTNWFTVLSITDTVASI